jgi:hypothetical protein
MNTLTVKFRNVEIDDIPRMATSLLLIPILVVMLGAWSCSVQQTQTWLQIAQSDLPVLSQEAVNILNLVNPADSAIAQQVSTAATVALTLITDAIAAYNVNPSATTLQAVAAAFDKAGSELSGLMQTLTFVNPTDELIVGAAVAAIVTTLDIIALQIPGSAPNAMKARFSRMSKSGTVKNSIPTPQQLKKNWNKNICSKGVNVTTCKLK